jgi:Xaa-Pro aminopeptidase
MLTQKDFNRDVERRINRVQSMMANHDLGALVIFGKAAPMGMGGIRYVTNAHLWGGDGYVVLGQKDPNPWLEIWSSYQAKWSRNNTSTLSNRVESPDNLIERTATLAKDYACGSKRIGMVNMNSLMNVEDYEQFCDEFEKYEMLEVTDHYNTIRRIKTSFEIEAFRENGQILDSAMDIFREKASIGARYMDICAEVERHIRSYGGFWGWTKLSLDLSPYGVPRGYDERIQRGDVINFEIDYESRWGYWTEMTTVFSFGELPDAERARLDGYLQAVQESASVAKPGNTFGDISEKTDETLVDLGFSVAGKHTPDCHSIGLDAYDGPHSIEAPEFELKENMVLSFHPGTILEDDLGFILSDNFLVTENGGVRLSPHDSSRYHLRIDNA